MESSTLKEAYEEIERLSQNPKTQRLAEFKERELKDINQRLYDAREDGIESEKNEAVIRMYSDGMPVESIVKYSQVSFERVLEIINSMKQ